MELLRKLFPNDRGQGVSEYMLIVFLVTLAFWLGVKDTNIGIPLSNLWNQIIDCLGAPFSCSSGS